MSNKSGVAEQVISHPTGGGAVTGIGEKFSPDLFTGTGNFTVPIDLPAGRNEFQPELSLTYSTGNGNGPFGLGWALSVPGVGRKTSEGVPLYDDTADTFILSGAEDLVPVAEVSDGPPNAVQHSRYQPRTEGLFAHIIHQTSATDDHWRVWSKDGLKSIYGTPETRGADPAALADPADPANIFAWRLTRTEDPFGNQIAYEYLRDSGDDGQHRWDQPHVERIRYVDYEGADGTEYLVSVTFDYEDRPDPFSEYRSGFEIRTTQRCKRITIRTHAHEEQLVRTYELTYLDERAELTDRLPLNGVSLLSRIEVVGHDGDATERLPPLEFAHTQFDPEGREFSSLDGDLPARSLASPNLELADLFGNGLSDIVEINDTVRYWRNLGGGRFDEPRSMDASPAGLTLADQDVQLIDANGDSRIDLLATTNGLSGYFPLAFGGRWDADSFQRYDAAPSFNLEDPEVQLIDLDGDGVIDAIRSGSRFECFFNDSDEGWNRTRQVPRGALEVFPNVNFSDPRVNWADLSGDGLQDIALVHDGNIEYWPNLGHGNWGHRLHMHNSPRFPYNYDPDRLLFGDVDGDGRADLVYVDDNKILLWLNQSGERWSDPIEITGTPSVSNMDAVRLVDLLGTGIQGVLWSADAGGTRDRTFFLDFTDGTKPYLLNEMDNHMGAITRVSYAPSTEFYLADEEHPETRWETPLPFPVQVVSQVESIDAISEGKLTTEYRYHHGYWDGAEREFRGFGMVEQLDTETFEEYNRPGLHGEDVVFETVSGDDEERDQFSEPTLTKTWFHQGPIGEEFGDWHEPDYSDGYWPEDPQTLSRPETMQDALDRLPRRAKRDALRTLRGRVLRTEVYALDETEHEERPYTVTEQLHGIREEHPPQPPHPPNEEQDRRRIFFPHTLAKRTTQWERGDEPLTQFAFTGTYDDYGQPRSEISIAVPRNRDFWQSVPDDLEAEPYLAMCAVTDYAQRDDEETYIVDRVARSTTYEISNDGRVDLFALKDSIETAIANSTLSDETIIGQTINFYDGPAFRGGAFGSIDEYGALVRTENLVLTDELLEDAYERDDIASIPPYLTVGASTEWSEYPDDFRAEYSKEFVASLPATQSADPTRPDLRITPAGYGMSDGEGDATFTRGHFAATERRKYDFHDGNEMSTHGSVGMVWTQRDTVGRDTTITYDECDCLPTTVEDPAGLVTEAAYDYRVLRPTQITDPNGNRTAYEFTPFGLPRGIAVMGKNGEEKGDTLEQPGTHFTYDLRAFEAEGQPVSVQTITRENHRWKVIHENSETDPAELFPEDELDRFPERFIRTREYSDGFGRVVQTRTQAEDVVFGDPTFGGDELLIDQAVLVRSERSNGFMPETLAELVGHNIGVRARTHGERLAEEIMGESEGDGGSEITRYGSSRAAVTALETGEIEAVIVDESVATTFATQDPVDIALVTGPGEAIGQELPDSEQPRVVVSGWQTYDNKGQVIEKYEPFFASGWEYLSRSDAAENGERDLFGQKATMYYDPRGQVIRTVNPDGSEQQVVYGVPVELNSPAEHTPTPWEAYTYDTNDNAGRSHGTVSETDLHLQPVDEYKHHWDTPSHGVIDPLGRTVEAVERTRDKPEEGDPLQPPEEHHTRSTYDIRGNPLTMTDALGREAFRHDYDLANNPLRIESIDAGVRVTVLDAAGNEIERRDSKGALMLQAYDDLNRPIRLWARDEETEPDESEEPLTLRERLVYGDGSDTGLPGDEDDPRVEARQRNLLGELYKHYDEAGLLTVAAYDFKGNVREKARQVITDDVITTQLPIDWHVPDGTTVEDHAATLVDASSYDSSVTYDALNRVTSMRYPEDVDGDRKELRPRYNRAGALEHVELVSQPGTADETVDTYVEHIAYDAKGQRTIIAYGNGVMTRYGYEPESFRLVRLRTDSYTTPSVLTYRPDGDVLQDFSYEYDLAGNITTIRDRTPGSGVIDTRLGRDALDRVFEYDPLYRLRSATGRECTSIPSPRPWTDYEPCGFQPPSSGMPTITRSSAPQHTALYTEEYAYDAAGNMRAMVHRGGSELWTREFSTEASSNRLIRVGAPDTADRTHFYDANGNLIQEKGKERRRLGWDHSDQLRTYSGQKDEAGIDAYYLYDAAGQRVKKLVNNGSTTEVTVYIDGVFEHYRQETTETKENNTLHVMDDETRIATVHAGAPFDTDTTPAVKFYLGDYLGSSNVVVDQDGGMINQEEYTPYGETSFGSFARKRYRFTGKERDEESGLYYHGSRYYAPWLARWMSCDPLASQSVWNSPYAGFGNNPVNRIDPDGQQDVTPETGEPRTHTVQKGENLTDIAEKYGQTVDNLAAWNHIGNRSLIHPETTLLVSDPQIAQRNAVALGDEIAITEYEKYIEHYTEYKEVTETVTERGGGTVMAGTLALSGVLLADDATGIGVADDVAIPVVMGVGSAIAGILALTTSTTTTRTRVVPIPRTRTRRRRKPLTYVTYTKTNPTTGEVYVGRTSGYGDPFSIVNARDRTHHKTRQGFGPAVIDRALPATLPHLMKRLDPSYWAIRGREQQMIDALGGSWSDVGRGRTRSGNKIRGVAKTNPRGRSYDAAASITFGRVAPYTGI